MIRENQRLFNRLNVLAEMAVLEAAVIISYAICYYAVDFATPPFSLTYVSVAGIVLLPVYIFVYSFFKTYAPLNTIDYRAIVKKTVAANSIVIVPVIALLLAFRLFYQTWLLFIVYYAVCLLMMILKRSLLKCAISSMRKRGINCRTVIICGCGKPATEYLEEVQNNTAYQSKFIGYVADSESLDGEYLGNYSELYDILNRLKPDELVCALDRENADKLEQIVDDCEKTGTRISVIPYCYEFLPAKAQIDQVGGIPLINLRQIPLDNNGKAFVKRVIDIIGSSLFLLVASPFFLLFAILIKCTSKGPVIFKQQRVGKDKKLFTMYKFRTMVVNSDENTGWTTDSDPRKTKIGAFMRKFSLDEWPQFFNVLKGDMSLVGPRAEIPYHVKNFQTQIPRYMVKHQVKPGITGLAQVNGWRGNTSIVKRIECDIYYIENWTLMMDIAILFRTVFAFSNKEQLNGNGESKSKGE